MATSPRNQDSKNALTRNGEPPSTPATVRPASGALTPAVAPGKLDVSRLSTPELVARIAEDAQQLVKAEMVLAKSELRAAIEGIGAMIKGMAAASLFLAAGLLSLTAAAILGLSLVLPPWAAALVVAGSLLLLGAILAAIAARRRPRSPFERTRRSLTQETVIATGAKPTPAASQSSLPPA